MPKCHSTNDVANELLSATSPSEGQLIITEFQEKGRGQRGNSWQSAPGKNLTFSLILYPRFLPVDKQYFLNMAVALCICDALKAEFQDQLKIKWPNDVLYGKQKIAGILIENQLSGNLINASVIGIGLNVNQDKFDGLTSTTSLRAIAGKDFDRFNLLENMMKYLEQRYLQLRNDQFDLIKSDYIQNLFGFNEFILFETDEKFEAKVIDVDAHGRLGLMKRDQSIEFYAFKMIKHVF